MPKKILVIEDEEATSHMFKSMLEGEGFTVEVAENGEVGLEKVKKFNPDLILLDILMPVKAGYQVLKSLQSEGEEGHIPVIVLTSLSQEKEERLARLLGADDFLRKDDVHLEDIMEKINRALKKVE